MTDNFGLRSNRRNRHDDDCDCHDHRDRDVRDIRDIHEDHDHHEDRNIRDVRDRHRKRDDHHRDDRNIRDIRDRHRNRDRDVRDIRDIRDNRNNCRGCVCDQLRRLDRGTEVDVFLSGGRVLEDVIFLNFNRRNCCAFFEDETTERGTIIIVDCEKIDAIRIEDED